jgi:hypothetical protein
MLDLDRITNPLRLASGSHQPGSGKGCAMNVISYINGDTKITDYPDCSARPLARMVQALNDRLAGPDGFLSPQDSLVVLDLGWLTVGTAGAPQPVVWRWLADLLVDPEHGVVKHARPDGAEAIRRVAALCLREAAGGHVSVDEWRAARAAADAASAAASDADAYAAYAADAASAAASAAYASDAYAASAAYAAYAASASDAYDADAYAASRIAFARWAITRWRDLAGLDAPPDISAGELDSALDRIGCIA